MASGTIGLYKVGGACFIISGLLFFSRYLLDLAAGPPPSTGPEILEWVAANELTLAIANEVLFFAVGFLVPAVVALHLSLASADRVKAAVGCGIIAVVIPVLAMLDIVHGRLVYPVYDLHLSNPAVAELIVAMFYGGLHAVSILLGVATIAVSLAMKGARYGREIAYLGIATGVFQFLGAYPEAVGPILMLVSQLLFAVWFLAVGWRLYRNASVWALDAA